MVKHRHSKDKQYITKTEHKRDWGGKQDPSKAQIHLLPFNCCSLGLQPFENPVCNQTGNVFELVNIIPFVKKFKQCPVTGVPLKMSDLVRLNFHKNAQGEFHDPISFKVFTDHTTIVAIKTSGNVYSADTVEELNRKPKYWKDLVSSQPFTHKDILTIQDPKNIEKRSVKNFDYVRQNIEFDLVKKPERLNDFINQTSTTKKVLEQYNEKVRKEEKEKSEKSEKEQQELQELIKKQNSKNSDTTVQEFIDFAVKTKMYTHTRETTNFQSVSVTTSASDGSKGVTEFRPLTESEIRKLIYDEVKGRNQKGYITMKTTVGDLNFRIHCNMVPITSENFLELAQKGYYKNQKFHRLVKDFMLQGGDPTGTGTGGQSIFGDKFQDEFHAKLKHSDPGILSMANSGPDTNGSQFFITLAECEHLDNVHSIFGEIMGGMPTLYKVNQIPVKNEKPQEEIILEDIIVHENPFRDAIKTLKESKKQENRQKNLEKDGLRDKDRWISEINGFQPVKKQQKNAFDYSSEEEDQEDDKNKNNKNTNNKTQNKNNNNINKPPAKAGILDSIMGIAPAQNSKSKRTNFNFNNW